MQMTATMSGYPIDVSYDYPGRTSRLTALFRGILVIPVAIVLYVYGIAYSITTVLAWFGILFTGKYPQGLYEFGVNYCRMQAQVAAYWLLLTDEYPAFSGGDPKALSYPVQVVLQYPERSSRLMLFLRGFALIPHFFFIMLVGLFLYVVMAVAFVAILITGRYPDGMRGIVEGALRYFTRVHGYMYLMTDRYPPFGFSE